MGRFAATVAGAATVVLVAAGSAGAAPGDLDPAYGTGGRAAVDLPEEQGVTDLSLIHI